MGLRSLISLGLMLVPIAVTIGVLLGLDAYRSASGGSPLFVDNTVHNDIYCQKAFGIHPKSKGEEFTLNPNQWNWKETGPGGLCMHVTSNANGSYPTNATAPAFWATWSYPQGEGTTANGVSPVHAFPNVKLDTTGLLPVQLQSVSNFNFEVEWHYGLGSEPGTTTDVAAVTAGRTGANVAIDMFLDPDKSKATDGAKAAYEIMVWFAVFDSASTRPLGYETGVVTTVSVDGSTFNLYYGQNQQSQYVLTWLPATTVETFNGNLMPLIDALQNLANPAVQVPSPSDYLGYVAFGSEAFYADQNVTFNVPSLAMQILKN